MATIAEAVAAALANFPGYIDDQVGDWSLKSGTVGQPGSREYGKLVFTVDNGNGSYTPVVIPLIAMDRALATEACLCNRASPTAAQQWYAIFRVRIQTAIKALFPATYCHVGTIEWGDAEMGVPSCVAQLVKTADGSEVKLCAYFDLAYPSEHLATKAVL